jgi:secreted trypsin-like serine protease
MLPSSACTPAGITTGELCVDSHGGHGICLGDSGGPAVQQLLPHTWRALGIVSPGAGTGCGDAVIVLTNLVYHRPWILHVVLTGHA